MSRRRRVLRFGVVGIANTLIDLGLYALLRHLGVGLLLANFVSTTAGLTFSFFANRSYTFAAREGNPFRQAMLFMLTTGVGLWVIQPLAIAGVERAVDLPPGAAVLFVPKLAGIVVGAVWNYVFYEKLVFRARPAATDEAPAVAGASAEEPPPAPSAPDRSPERH